MYVGTEHCFFPKVTPMYQVTFISLWYDISVSFNSRLKDLFFYEKIAKYNNKYIVKILPMTGQWPGGSSKGLEK